MRQGTSSGDWDWQLTPKGLVVPVLRDVTVTMGPQQVPGGNWVLHCRDPQGAVFALMSMTK